MRTAAKIMCLTVISVMQHILDSLGEWPDDKPLVAMPARGCQCGSPHTGLCMAGVGE